jgi:hypothetical protein
MIDNRMIARNLIERLAPCGSDATDPRVWRFSERMAAVYKKQMQRFEEDTEARQWRRLYSEDNMPPPSITQSKAEVAAMMAFYSPTNYCKFQKLLTQQLLEWHYRQAQMSPHPFGAQSITLIDIGAGVGIASLAAIDLLATWAEVLAERGYGHLGMSARIVAVEPDSAKQGPRHHMLADMASMLDTHSVRVEGLTEICSPYPDPECIKLILDAVGNGSLAILCMSNFLSSLDTDQPQIPASVVLSDGPQAIDESDDQEEVMQWTESPVALENAVHCSDATGYLLANLPFRDSLLLAAELKQRGPAVRAFSRELHTLAELSVRMNHIRFYAPHGSYWYSLRRDEQAADPDWATGFWSLAHWNTGTANRSC